MELGHLVPEFPQVFHLGLERQSPSSLDSSRTRLGLGLGIGLEKGTRETMLDASKCSKSREHYISNVGIRALWILNPILFESCRIQDCSMVTIVATIPTYIITWPCRFAAGKDCTLLYDINVAINVPTCQTYVQQIKILFIEDCARTSRCQEPPTI